MTLSLLRNPFVWIHLDHLELCHGPAKGEIQGKIQFHQRVSPPPLAGDQWRVCHLGEKGQVCSGSPLLENDHEMISNIQVEYKTHDGKKKKSKLLTSGFWGLARHLNYVFELLLALSWRWPTAFEKPNIFSSIKRPFGLGGQNDSSVCPSLICFQSPLAWPWNSAFCVLRLPTDLTCPQVSILESNWSKAYVFRVFRDEEKCSGKYGDGWKTYCEQVEQNWTIWKHDSKLKAKPFQVPYRMIPGLFWDWRGAFELKNCCCCKGPP